jgi:hypothetical protein
LKIHEAFRLAQQLAILVPNMTHEAGINKTQNIGQYDLLKGGREFLIFCEHTAVPPHNGVALLFEAGKDEAAVLVVEAEDAASSLLLLLLVAEVEQRKEEVHLLLGFEVFTGSHLSGVWNHDGPL